MIKLLSLILLLMFGSFSCTVSYDDETIAMIGRQKISKVLFHKQIPEVGFNALSDSLKVEKVEEFLKDLLIERDIQKLELENNPEIVKEMNLWSKRALSGILFDKKILNKLFPEDSLKKIYNNFKKERNISVIVIPYIKEKTEKIPDIDGARGIAEDIYNRSKIEKFEYLQSIYSKVKGNQNEIKSHWTQLFSGIKSVDRVLWKYKVGQITKPIDDGQSFRIIKINAERENTKIPNYEYHKDVLIKEVVDLWQKPLQEYFIFYTDSLLNNAQFYIDQNKVKKLAKSLQLIIKNNNVIEALKMSDYDEKIGKYRGILLDRKWFLKKLQEEENIFAYQLADIRMAYGFIRGFITSKVNHDTAIKMDIQNSPSYKDKYKKELSIRTNNFYELNVYMKGLDLKENEMIDFYSNNKKDFSVPPKIFVQMIYFDNKEDVWSEYKKIGKNNFSFDDLYLSVNKKNNRKSGAKKTFISSTSFSDPYKKLFDLDNGSVSKPFLRGNKFYIIKVIEKIEAQIRPYKEVKSQIYMRLTKKLKKRNEAIARKRLLRKYNASVNEDLIQL
ncbi:MAG: peptidyl-prolyl cis-trans isomerase [Candidatus Neomarinimicrobiota bacterium]